AQREQGQADDARVQTVGQCPPEGIEDLLHVCSIAPFSARHGIGTRRFADGRVTGRRGGFAYDCAMNRIDIEGIGLEVAHIPGAPDKAPLIFLHEGLGSVAMWPQRGRDWPRELCERTGRSGWLYSRRGYGQSDPVAEVRAAPRMAGFWHVGRHEP